MFLDPRPTVEDIGKVYENYYTHSPKTRTISLVGRLRNFVRNGYLANQLGYTVGITRLQRIAGLLPHLHPEEREVIKYSVMYLASEQRGRVLEVGSGSGEALNELRKLGWEVEGVDFDAAAIQTSRKNYDLNVKLGTLEDQEYPSDCFDAVIMGHVIEHVHDPVALLAECRRVLKPGGRLVIATPNVRSLGHNYNKVSWLQLDPPRHLALFSCETLARAAYKAGLQDVVVKTTVRGAYGSAIDSHRIRKALPNVTQPPGSVIEKLRGHAYQYLVAAVLRFVPGAGEELLMVAVK